MGKRNHQRMINALCAYAGGHEATCPNCDGHNFNDACVVLKTNDDYGFGAFWCEDCRQALMLCRTDLKDERARKKIVPALPDDLKYV